MFSNDIAGKNTQLYPVVKIGNDYFSTNNVSFEGNYCKPILLNIPSIKQSVDIESRKFKISNVSLDLSNFPVSGERFSDRLSTSSLINTEVIVYFVQHDTSEEVYRGQIRRISHDDEKVKIELEDLTEKKIQKELPQEKQKNYFKSDLRYVPMVYGSVDKSPTLPTSTQGDSFNIGSISHSLLFDGDRNIGYKLGDDLRLKIDYKEIEGFDEYKVNGQGFYNPLFLYENGKYHRVLESAQKALITDEEDTNLYKVFSQYSTPEGYIENYIDINSRFDSDSDDPSENNFKNLPSSGIVQCYKKQKFLQWNINIPYQAPSFDSPAQGFFLSPQNPSGESNELSISGTIETDLNLDFPYDNQVFDNCLIKFKIDEVPSIPDSKIFTYYNPRLSIGLSSTSSFRVVFNIYDSNGDIKNSGSGTLIPTQSSVGTYEYYIDEYNLDYETTDDKSFSISAFEWAVVDTYTTSGTVVNLTSTINDFDIYNIYNLNFIDKNFYVDVKGRVNTFGDSPISYEEYFIENPIEIIYDILRSELGLTNNQIDIQDFKEARLQHLNWKFGFTINKKINSKKLIEEIAKSTKCFPHFKNDGTFSFNTIKDSYTVSDIVEDVEKGDYKTATEIKEQDVINYSFKKTKPEQIYKQVDVQYEKDYAQDSYLKRTDPYPSGDNQDYYYGIEQDGAVLEFESDYIRHDDTANELRNFLEAQYRNNHLIFNLKLPLSYNQLEVGDLIKFRSLLNGVKAYGIDYRAIDEPNGQVYYPLFMITSTKKNLDSVEIECMQLHHLSGSIEGDLDANTGWYDYNGLFNFPDHTPVIATQVDEEIDTDDFIAYSGDDIQISGNVTSVYGSQISVGVIDDYDYSGLLGDANHFTVEGLDFEPQPEFGLDNIVMITHLYNENSEYQNSFTIRSKQEIDHDGDGIADDLNIIPSNFTVEEGQQVTFTLSSYTVPEESESTPIGNVNFDSVVNILDVVLLVSFIMGTQEPTDEQEFEGDINGDGGINVLDIVHVVDRIIEG